MKPQCHSYPRSYGWRLLKIRRNDSAFVHEAIKTRICILFARRPTDGRVRQLQERCHGTIKTRICILFARSAAMPWGIEQQRSTWLYSPLSHELEMAGPDTQGRQNHIMGGKILLKHWWRTRTELPRGAGGPHDQSIDTIMICPYSLIYICTPKLIKLKQTDITRGYCNY